MRYHELKTNAETKVIRSTYTYVLRTNKFNNASKELKGTIDQLNDKLQGNKKTRRREIKSNANTSNKDETRSMSERLRLPVSVKKSAKSQESQV